MVLEHKNAANIGTASSYLELSRQRFEEQSEAYWLLREASRAGDLRTTLTLLHSGTDVNPCATCTTDNTDIDMEEEELTPLHEAAAQGHIAIVRTLLTAGALPNCLACCADLGFEKPRRLYKVAPGATMLHNQALAPLHLAARFGHVEVVRLLAEANGDVNVRGSFLRDTPLHMAAWHGHMQVMRLLLEKGADVNAVDRCGGSPLHVADSLQGREILLRAGANPNLVMNAPWGQGAPLRMVLVRIHEGVSKVEKEQALEYVRLLLAHGATATSDVKSTSRCPLPSIQHLSLAVFIGVARIISMMLEVGFDPNEPDMLLRSCGAYPIHHAAREGRVEILQLLLKAGARLDVRDKTTFDSTPLHVACRYAQVGAVRELLRWGADMTVLDRPDSNGERKTPAGVISLRKAFRPNDNSVADPSQYEREELLSEDAPPACIIASRRVTRRFGGHPLIRGHLIGNRSDARDRNLIRRAIHKETCWRDRRAVLLFKNRAFGLRKDENVTVVSKPAKGQVRENRWLAGSKGERLVRSMDTADGNDECTLRWALEGLLDVADQEQALFRRVVQYL